MHQDYAWFLNVFVHDINLLRFLMGSTPAVTGVDLNRPNGRLVTFDFGECPAILEMAEIPFAHWDEGVEILFEGGALRLRLQSPLIQAPALVELHVAGQAPVPVNTGSGWAFRAQAAAFVAEIAEGRPALAGGEDSLDDLRLVEAIWRRHLGQQGAS
jgi:predicted dehydrogenase